MRTPNQFGKQIRDSTGPEALQNDKSQIRDSSGRAALQNDKALRKMGNSYGGIGFSL